eukprot:1171163-Pyramimonas_sp.AAC.1
MKLPELPYVPLRLSENGQGNAKGAPDPSDGGVLSVSQASFLLIAAVVGLGIMALPSSIAKVGWVPGLVILGFVFTLNLYTGMILWRLRLVYPTAS